MLKIYISLITFLLLPTSLWSQEDISIGKKYSIFSATLNEERIYWVHLPVSYSLDIATTYPVIYLLDGESFFHTLVGISKTLSSGKKEYLPPSIIVGVLNTDRTRDFTPTVSAFGRDGSLQPDKAPEGGGSDLFYTFLIKELRTIIEKTYRTSGQNTLIGHSYAGLFALDTFLRYPEQFDNYLLVDPSLWWDQGKLVAEAYSLIKEKDFSNRSLYIGIATQRRRSQIGLHLEKASDLFTKVLPQAKNLHFYTKSFPEESHGTVAISGIYDGIKQLSAQ